ncbi:response regulator transcription factor [Flavobacterium sp. IMCC34852]|uniref:Response regulator transcription factor n=1 Tax=Flavobacterium rivulicola TaxID=2732161 RepID=A0A7Y3R854_9FLAO|nr:response regulator [Flavobacterium sp. IMCC34852]NNT71679.1 response regulator transcription factor [Flavobacterium sp. IMCC34852]
MFKRVLVAEDIDSINIAVMQTLTDLQIEHIDHVKYCDDALLKIKKGLNSGEPYDLFISDLSFEPDHREVRIQSGDVAIEQIRVLQPEIKIIVYSIEDKGFKIKSLLEQSKVNAYVHKGRHSIDQLKAAILQVSKSDEIYLSPHLAHVLRDKSTREIDDFDVELIKQLSIGITQDELENRFKELGITPNSKSTIEKRLSKLKDHFRANNTVHLIAIAKDLGIA